MTADEAIHGIKEVIPTATVGMIEKENGQFEVWAKDGHQVLGYKSATSLAGAFTLLLALVSTLVAQR